jgi:Uma2 family endonuclease
VLSRELRVTPTGTTTWMERLLPAKLRLYHRVAIPHYWLVDPRDATLTVLRWSDAGYITVPRAERHEVVRPEPFEAIELAVGTLFGEDPP